tara:strand:- start:354 stop:650 length:297 start_codon:yes stop_codon:yes gene_type:complete
MGLIDWVKNLVAKFWAGLERFVADEAKYLAEQKAKAAVKEKVEEKVEVAKETVSEVVEEVKEKAEDKVKSVKKRARTKLGRYIADDPTTPKNEAYEDK